MKKLLLSAIVLSSLYSCTKKEDPIPVETPKPNAAFTENKLVRLMVTDAVNSNLYFVDGFNYDVETITDFPHNAARAYSTASGRYAGIVSTSGNLVKFFDSGIETINDKVVTVGLPKWARTISNGVMPIHFYGHKDLVVMFNDGDGSLSLFNERDLHTTSLALNLPSGNTAHHGAPAVFDNGTIAITHKDTSVNKIAGALPEFVKIVDMTGKEVHPINVRTGGIHGEACNGVTALFGSRSGILKIDDNGTQELIAYPTTFGTTWLGSIFYGKESKVFVGFRRGFGVFKIDPVSKTITTISDETTFNSVTFDESGKYLILLHNTGKLTIINPVSGAVVRETTSKVGFPATGNANMPIVRSTKNVIYVADAVNKKILTYNKADMSLVKEIPLPGAPLSVTIIGFDGNE